MSMSTASDRKIVVLTEGCSDPVTAKTGASVIRYCEDEVLAVLDSTHAGKRAAEILGAGADIPVVASLGEVPAAKTLLIGTAPTGGRMPESWRTIICQAIENGLHIVSGLHDFLSDDDRFSSLAKQHGVTIRDVRRNTEKGVSAGQPLGNQYLRIHTVGNDCCVGKMVVTIELDRALQAQGHDSKFLATGQTGIMIAGEGVPIDCVVSDFVSGAAERLVLQNRAHEILLIEGQGSIAHPMYSAVTLGLLHGCQPQGLILCYEAGRSEYDGVPGRKLCSLNEIRQACEVLAALVQPTQVIGVAMNGRLISPEQAEAEKRRVQEEVGLPVCDVFRDGPDVLVRAIEQLHESLKS